MDSKWRDSSTSSVQVSMADDNFDTQSMSKSVKSDDGDTSESRDAREDENFVKLWAITSSLHHRTNRSRAYLDMIRILRMMAIIGTTQTQHGHRKRKRNSFGRLIFVSCVRQHLRLLLMACSRIRSRSVYVLDVLLAKA